MYFSGPAARPVPAPLAHAAAHRIDPRTRLLLEAPITPTLLAMAAPNVLVMMVQASVGLIETYFIGWLGTRRWRAWRSSFPPSC